MGTFEINFKTGAPFIYISDVQLPIKKIKKYINKIDV